GSRNPAVPDAARPESAAHPPALATTLHPPANPPLPPPALASPSPQPLPRPAPRPRTSATSRGLNSLPSVSRRSRSLPAPRVDRAAPFVSRLDAPHVLLSR